MENKAAAILLTAGFSSRMGAFKPLLPMGEITALERVLITLNEAGLDPVIAVTGYRRESLLPILSKHGVLECFNPAFAQGMFSSVQAGTGCFRKNKSSGSSGSPGAPEGFFLVPVDCPLIPVTVYKAMLTQRDLHPDKMIVPCYRGKKGHPLYIPAAFADEILACDGKEGMKGITDKDQDRLVRLEVPDEAVVMDMDTREAYLELLEYMEDKGRDSRPLARRRLFLVRHGQIRQHEEPILLGQTDVPLSELGKIQAEEAAAALRRHAAAISSIYTSDLQRAHDTAEIIAGALSADSAAGRPDVTPMKEFREMALGSIDGMYVSQFKKQYPAEYERRGSNRLIYKTGNESENFYDLQYRVMKKLKRLAAETAGDLVLVTHGGVIRVILSNLLGIPLEEALDMKIENGKVLGVLWDPTGESSFL